MSFQFVQLELPGLILVQPTAHEDSRGFFMETYRRSAFVDAGLPLDFPQDNLAHSTRGVLRGLHFQKPPAAQGKLVSVPAGEVFDVAVDLRSKSPSFGRSVGVVLSESNQKMLYVPPGFAHGYCVLSDTALLHYKVSSEYDARLDSGIRWDDDALGIEWPITDPVVSPKDASLPLLREIETPF